MIWSTPLLSEGGFDAWAKHRFEECLTRRSRTICVLSIHPQDNVGPMAGKDRCLHEANPMSGYSGSNMLPRKHSSSFKV